MKRIKVMTGVVALAVILLLYALIGMYWQWPGGRFCLKLGLDILLICLIVWVVQLCTAKNQDC